MNLLNKNIEPIDPDTVAQLVLPNGTHMPQAAMGTFHSDNPDLWAHQRENNQVGYVAMAERLVAATKNALSQKQFEAINGDGIPWNKYE